MVKRRPAFIYYNKIIFSIPSILDEYFRSIMCFKSESGDEFVADFPNKMSPTGKMSMKTRTGSTKHKKRP